MDGNQIVIWSGGCDSTLVLTQLLKSSSENKPVIAISIIFDQIDKDKTKLEIQAREKLKKEFKKRGYHLKHYTINISSDYTVSLGDKEFALSQPPIWAIFLTPYIKNKDIINFGYILGDHMWRIVREFESIIDNTCKIMGKFCKINYPLETKDKEMIVKELKEEKLLNLCWTCESPIKNKPCNKCDPCQHLNEAKSKCKKQK